MSTLYVDQILPKNNANIALDLAGATPAPGSVIQVVQSKYSTQTGISSGSFTATGLNATITPKFASSKILVTSMISLQGSGSGGVGFAIYRGGVQVFADPNAYNGAYYVYANNWRTKVPLEFLDSPATTSAINYSIQMNAYSITGYLSTEGSMSTITLMEIAQ